MSPRLWLVDVVMGPPEEAKLHPLGFSFGWKFHPPPVKFVRCCVINCSLGRCYCGLLGSFSQKSWGLRSHCCGRPDVMFLAVVCLIRSQAVTSASKRFVAKSMRTPKHNSYVTNRSTTSGYWSSNNILMTAPTLLGWLPSTLLEHGWKDLLLFNYKSISEWVRLSIDIES